MENRMTLKGTIFSALFAAMLVVMSYLNIQLGFSPVPISLENMVIMLAGGILGATYGFFSIFTVIFLTALGLPLLHGNGGLSLILGPTGGFIWMYPISALLIGFFISKIKGKTWRDIVLIFLVVEIFGSLLVYVTGVPWLAHVAGLSAQKALLLGCYPYLLGDAVKAVIATLIIVPVKQVFPISRITGRTAAK